MTPTWIGNPPANFEGDAGLLYRRNQFFDPASGRFTQEDPIGLAGGLNLYGFAGGDPITFSDPFGLFAVDDIYYNEYGAETRRVVNDAPDRHFLETNGQTYRLDYGLKEGGSPYQIHADISETNATAQSLAGAAPVFDNRLAIAKESMPNGQLDFKAQLPDRSLWSIGSGTLGHKHVVGNMAWGNYMARRGYALQESLSGARKQGFLAGGEDPLDQRMIIRGYSLFKP